MDDIYYAEQGGLHFAGTHLLLDTWRASSPTDADAVEAVMRRAVTACGAAKVLFRQAFYDNCRHCLRDGGSSSPRAAFRSFRGRWRGKPIGNLRALFPHTGLYVAAVSTNYGGHMAFEWGCRSLDMACMGVDAIRARHAAANLATRYYNPDVHVASFALPSYIRDPMVA